MLYPKLLKAQFSSPQGVNYSEKDYLRKIRDMQNERYCV